MMKDFLQVMADHNVTISDDEIKELIALANESGEVGKVSLTIFAKKSEFWESLRPLFDDIRVKMDKSRTAFVAMDKNKDRFVDKKEFARTLEKLGSENVDLIFRKFDKNNDERLSFAEFRAFMCK